MISSRVSKLKELQSHDKVMDVLSLWNTTEDDIETISNKTLLPKREVELILLTLEATKLVENQKEISKPNLHTFVKIVDIYFNVDNIIAIREINENEYKSKIFTNSDNNWRTTETIEKIIKSLGIVCEDM